MRVRVYRSALSWLGGVHGHPVTPLGVTEFGQTGDVLELYERYEIDEAAILRACEQIC